MKLAASPVLLMGCLFLGLPLGGLRHPLLWTAFAAFIWVLASVPSERDAALSDGEAFKPWLPWLAWALLSLLVCDQPWRGLFAFSRWLTLLVFFSLAAGAWRERDSRAWLAGLAAVAAVLGLATLVVPGTFHPRTGLIPPYYNYTVFVEAAFAAAALAAVGHRDGPRGWKAWALAAVGVFCVAMMVLARSRGGLVAVAAAAAFWAWRRGLRRPLLWGGLALALAAALAPPRAISFLLKLDLSAWFTRPDIWKAALSVTADHPLAGEGLGNFEAGFLRHNFPKHWASNFGFSADHAHSEILEIAAETGWVGLALFAWGLWASLRRNGRLGSSWTREAGLCAAAAMAVQCVFDNMLHLPALGMLFFTSLACAGAKDDAPGEAPAAARAGSAFLGRGLCVAGLILALTAWLPRWLVERHVSEARRTRDPVRRLEALGRAVRIFPAEAALREDLASALLAALPPQPGRALAELERARRLSPTNAVTLLRRAEVLLGLSGGADRAGSPAVASLLNRAVELEPNFLTARLLRAELWARAGERESAVRELGEVERRRASLQDEYLFTHYDRMIAACDPARLSAVRLLAARPEGAGPARGRRRR
ncbi:MAG: O-antigen ligase family protein [Elusimicrobia bacterium]|nr:O-antigen ligase family protein [Elusimicrobiota bacterium]